MWSEVQPGTLARPSRRTALLARVMIFTLLLAVAGLATMAKNGQYFPGRSAPHYVSLSTKMNEAHSPVYFAGDHLQPVTIVLLPRMPALRVEVPAVPASILRIYLTDYKQLRAPPASLS